jgi:hypothetical protein
VRARGLVIALSWLATACAAGDGSAERIETRGVDWAPAAGSRLGDAAELEVGAFMVVEVLASDDRGLVKSCAEGRSSDPSILEVAAVSGNCRALFLIGRAPGEATLSIRVDDARQDVRFQVGGS